MMPSRSALGARRPFAMSPVLRCTCIVVLLLMTVPAHAGTFFDGTDYVVGDGTLCPGRNDGISVGNALHYAFTIVGLTSSTGTLSVSSAIIWSECQCSGMFTISVNGAQVGTFGGPPIPCLGRPAPDGAPVPPPVIATTVSNLREGTNTVDIAKVPDAQLGNCTWPGVPQARCYPALLAVSSVSVTYTSGIQPPPSLTSVIPGRLVAGDTGTDIVLQGENLGSATVECSSAHVTIGSVVSWSSQRLHATVSIDGDAPAGSVVVTAVAPGGVRSNGLGITVARLSAPHPSNFAPVWWPAPGEIWLPTTPFFADRNGNTQYGSPEDRDVAYQGLSRAQKRNQVTVYYRVLGDDHPVFPCPGGSGPDPCWVYEYWTYYTFDDFTLCGGPNAWNRHQHDWEKAFIFVDPLSRVRAVAVGAHNELTMNNVYVYATGTGPVLHRPTIFVELGAHAGAPDANDDDSFDRQTDLRLPEGTVAGYNDVAWGLRDGVLSRQPEDRLSISSVGPADPPYRLTSIEGLREVVEAPSLQLSTTLDFWDGSREQGCGFDLLRSLVGPAVTFRGSTVAQVVQPNLFEDWEMAFCSAQGWDELRPMLLGHTPPTQAWYQTEYSNPLAIIPSGAARGYFSRLADQCGTIAGLTAQAPASKAGTEAVPGGMSGFAGVGVNGEIGFMNVPAGTYEFSVASAGMAAYKQTLAIGPGDTQLGVEGRIELVPTENAFVLEMRVQDDVAFPVSGATLTVRMQPDQIVFSSLSDPVGFATVAVETGHTYTIMVRAGAFQDSLQVMADGPGPQTVAFTVPSQGVPVQVQDFVAIPEEDQIELGWRLTSPDEVHRVYVDRAEFEQGPFHPLNPLPLQPARQMQFLDRDVIRDQVAWYRVRWFTRDGAVYVGPVLRVVMPTLTPRLWVTPLAVSGNVDIRFDVGHAVGVPTLTGYDIAGRRVWQRAGIAGVRGDQRITWAASSGTTSGVARGVYMIELRVGDVRLVRKCVILAGGSH